MLYACTFADTIYFKELSYGTLYLLKFNFKNRKRILTVDNRISSLDSSLKIAANSNSTLFRSIGSVCDGPSSKVRAIPNDYSLSDEYYCDIFDVTSSKGLYGYPLCGGVSLWTIDKQRKEDRDQDCIHDADDILVQQEAMAEDPDAYGGHTTLDSSSKMMVAREYAAAEERFGAASGSDGEGGVTEEEYAPEEDGHDDFPQKRKKLEQTGEGEVRYLNVELEQSKKDVKGEVSMLREASVKNKAKFAAEMEEVCVV